MSASRHLVIDGQYSTTATADATATTFFDTSHVDGNLTLDDWTNGNSDFEYAWTEMMRIMVPITILRMIPRQGDKGTSERQREGERIQGLLTQWEASLPESFREIEQPEMMIILDDEPVLQQLQPLYYISHNVAVAMGNNSPSPRFYPFFAPPLVVFRVGSDGG